MNKIELGVIVPCHNEEESIPIFYERMTKSIKNCEFQKYLIVFIDDGSTDKTWTSISTIAEKDNRVLGIRLSRNFGHQAALSAGLKEIESELYLIIDADCQDPPEILKDFIQILNYKSDIDIVYGKRESRKGETWFKVISAKLYYKFLKKISEIELPLDSGDFRIIRRHVRDAYLDLPERVRYARGLFVWLGFNSEGFRYTRQARLSDKSSYTFSKMITLGISGIVGFSLKPLRFAIYLGLGGLLTTLVLLAYAIFSAIFFDLQPGWLSIILVVSFVGSLNLVILGIVGEYISVLVKEVKGRPDYIISKRINTSWDRHGS
jgi:glycosyltransferase involved in cell wall biosynthesis